MEEKLQKLLDDKMTPEWCALLEEVFGQIANYINRIGDYDLAELYHPNMKEFGASDFGMAKKVDEIPEDWLRYVYACMGRIGL